MKERHVLRRKFFNQALIRNNGIARRLLLALVLFSSAITAVITGVELYLDYRQDLRTIDERIDSIRRVYLPTLIESVSAGERGEIEHLLAGLLNLGDIEYVSIVADGKTQWSAGARASSRQVEQVIALNHMHPGTNVDIGALHVVASVDNVLDRLWTKLVVLLAGNGIKTLLVTAFVLLIFQAMVGQHLEHVAAYLRRFAKDVAAVGELRLKRPRAGWWRPDALDRVAAATNLMRHEMGRTHAELTGANQRLEAIIQNSPLALYARDMNDVITTWNPAAERMFGWTAAEAIGHELRTVPMHELNAAGSLSTRVRKGESIVGVERTRLRKDGSPINISLSIAPLRDAAGELYGYLTIVADITERKVAEQRIEFLAYHDSLTGLPNRLLLQDRFEQARAHAARAGTRVALLFLDLDNFKSINDSLGHDVGDTLLREIATRLGHCVRESDTICRHGGDEFLIQLPDLSHADDAAPVLLKVMEQMQEPVIVRGHEIATSVSMGVALFPDDGPDFETVLKKADMAMYQAKDAGRNTYRFFDEAMNVEAVEHLFIRNGLRRALERDEFMLYYQPQIDMASGAVVGVEALLRWNHPEQGMVTPARFIPVAEESGLIVPIGAWVLNEACRQGVAWRAAGLPELVVAVNLSAVQFKRGDVEQSVSQALQASGLAPELLELELTESIMIQNVEGVLASVKRLKLLGVKLSIDDFGTGYSSLSYLKRFDVDRLKIDQSFVRDLATDPDDEAIVRAIIQMAHSLNLKTIAEGVETVEMAQRLRSFACDEAQGYYYARPMPAQELAAYVRAAIGRP